MKRVAVITAAGVLAVAGGTAAAFPGGGPLGVAREDPKEEKAEFAREVATKLDGVSAAQVERALDQVHRERHAEHRRELAGALAAELDGVSQDEAENALEKQEAAMRRAFERRELPYGPPQETLAKELGVSRADLHAAFRAIHERRMGEGTIRFEMRGPGRGGHVRPGPGGPAFAMPAPPPPAE